MCVLLRNCHITGECVCEVGGCFVSSFLFSLFLMPSRACKHVSQGGVAGDSLSEDLRNALNAFLYRTGENTTKFMLVFATNQPEQLDWAITDRVDEVVEFALPNEQERKSMLQQYFETFILSSGTTPSWYDAFNIGGQRTSIQLDDSIKGSSSAGSDDGLFDGMARRTSGFSGREIAKLAISWQAVAYGTEDCVLNAHLMLEELDQRIAQRKQKSQWVSDK